MNKTLAVIPLRKGSKSIKNKNKRRLLGRPLYQWVLVEAIFSEIDEIVIATDDEEIIKYVNREYFWTKKISVLHRAEENAQDNSTTESVMEEVVSKFGKKAYSIICLIQATSPFLNKQDINNAIDLVKKENYDSSLSVVNQKRFIWDKNCNPVNYDVKIRPRRQDFDGFLVENGAIYVTKIQQFLTSGSRIGGNISLVKMDESSYYEIDEPSDFVIVEELLKFQLLRSKTRNKKISHIFIDVDGVLTNSKIGVSKNGELFKEFSTVDGMGIELANDMGITVNIITSEDSDIVKKRSKKLKIKNTFLGVRDKYSFILNYIKINNISKSSIAYIGDDINDLTNILSCGLSASPKNSISIVKDSSDIKLKREGGKGAVREFIEIIINNNKIYE